MTNESDNITPAIDTVPQNNQVQTFQQRFANFRESAAAKTGGGAGSDGIRNKLDKIIAAQSPLHARAFGAAETDLSGGEPANNGRGR